MNRQARRSLRVDRPRMTRWAVLLVVAVGIFAATSGVVRAGHAVELACWPSCTAEVGTAITFKASTTSGDVTKVEWDLDGDGEFEIDTGQELEISRSYEKPADFVVVVAVTEGGKSPHQTFAKREVVVVEADATPAFELPFSFLGLFGDQPAEFIPGSAQEPEGTALVGGNTAPRITVRIKPRRPRTGQIVTLNAGATKDDGKLAAVSWDLDGDGARGDARGLVIRTSFARTGTNSITVEALDDKGLNAVYTVTVHVRPGRVLPVVRAVERARQARTAATSFESGLSGWKRVGKAFPARPAMTPVVPASRDLETTSRLGGSYAQTSFPIGAKGRRWLSSFSSLAGVHGLSRDARGELATGILVSPAFRVSKRYLVLRIGGDDELRGRRSLARVDVWARTRGTRPRRIATVPAGENERLHTEVVDLARVRGRDVVVVAVDETSRGHVNLDAVALVERVPGIGGVPSAAEAPIVGFANTHSHPTAHQGFGGLKGHRTYMGVPGAAVTLYSGREGAQAFREDTRDLPTHNAGTLLLRAGFEIAHGALPEAVAPLHEQMHITDIRRAWEGGLRLISSIAVSNEALEYVTGQIVDRETGGGACVDLGGLCERDGRVRATIPTTRDRQVIEAHVLAMRQLVAANSDWMEIVYGPDQAYDAMSAGKLAVVLGSEVDSHGRLGFPSAEAEVDWLWSLGIRQVTPVHAIENPIGSPAIFQDLYNTTNDLINRPERDVRRDRMADEVDDNGTILTPRNARARFGALFRIENWGCGQPILHFEVPPGECINWRFDATQKLFALDTNRVSGPHPIFHTIGVDHRPVYSATNVYGQRNRGGLRPLGLRYVRALMRRGMLLDLEHMSDHTIDALIASGTIAGEARGPVWDALPAGQNGCEPGNVYRPRSVRVGCYNRAYPLMSSHTSFRGQSLSTRRSRVKGYWSREFERTPRQIEYIRESGGTIAPVIGHDPIHQLPWASRSARAQPALAPMRGEDFPIRTNVDARPDLNDCAGSSKSWITAYLYGVQKMGGRGIALSDDMAVVGSTAPRFNPPTAHPELPRNCPSSYAHFNPQFNIFDLGNVTAALTRETARSRDVEERLAPHLYNRMQDERTRVRYYDPSPGGSAQPPGYLRRHRTPHGRVYDFNIDGVKTYGAIPDLLQDAINVGVAPDDLRPLLRSAQDYVDMWRKAYRVTGCDVGVRTTRATYERCAGSERTPVAESVCANTCPNSPGRGHRLLPDGRLLFRSG